MRNYRIILVAFLCGITLFSIYKYTSSLVALQKVKEEANTLQKEKQNLLQDLDKEKKIEEGLTVQNQGLKQAVKENRERMIKLSVAYQRAFKKAEGLGSQVAALKAENTVLKDERTNIEAQVTQIIQENENFRVRLGSIAELKRAIRELRRQMFKVGTQIQGSVDAQETAEGNRGYLLKDGKVIFPTKVKIEVTPAPNPTAATQQIKP